MEKPKINNPHTTLETKKGSGSPKLVFTCPMIISDDSTEFFKSNLDSLFDAPGDLMKQLVKLCDGIKTIQDVKDELSKEWDLASLEELIDELVRRKILVDSTRKILDSFEVVKNPQRYFNEIDTEGTAKLEEDARTPEITGHQETFVKETPLIELISNRESVRRFSKEAIEQSQLETILWCAYGRLNKDSYKRTVPSGGALYPLRLNLVLFQKVGSYTPGIYKISHNEKGGVGLVMISENQDDARGDFIDPMTVHNSNGVLVISSDVSESSKKYGNRSFHYSVLEAGHVAQNFLLSGSEQSVGMVEIGGYYDDMIKKTIGNSENETPIISIVFGKEDTSPEPEKKSEPEFMWVKPEYDGYRLPFNLVLARLNEGLMKEWSSGRDKDPEMAKIKATSESREWASCSCIPENLKRAKMSDLQNVIDPRTVYSIAEEQFEGGSVPFKKFDPEGLRDWVEVTKYSDGSKHNLLADLVYFPFRPGYDTYGYATTSGVAAHPERHVATESAVLELIERDSFMIKYLAQIKSPTIKRTSLGKFKDRIEALERRGFSVTFKDISLDLAPVIMVYVTNEEMQYTNCSTSSDFNIEEAANHALMEVESAVLSRLSDGRSEIKDPSKLESPLEHGGLYHQPDFYKKAEFLIDGDEEIDLSNSGRFAAKSWEELIEKLNQKKMDLFIFEQSVFEKYGGNQGLNIVRAIIPGLVPITFGSNLEPGGSERIYQIAKEFGNQDLTYSDLTKFPHPFA
jgi:ribosomal protein S12 methylthiotransferase accessory factor